MYEGAKQEPVFRGGRDPEIPLQRLRESWDQFPLSENLFKAGILSERHQRI